MLHHECSWYHCWSTQTMESQILQSFFPTESLPWPSQLNGLSGKSIWMPVLHRLINKSSYAYFCVRARHYYKVLASLCGSNVILDLCHCRMTSSSGQGTTGFTTSTQRRMQTPTMHWGDFSFLTSAGCWFGNTLMSSRRERSWSLPIWRQIKLWCSRDIKDMVHPSPLDTWNFT